MERIMVVEDERKLNDLVRDYLASLGYEVVQCFDGPGALASFREGPVDLMVLDLMLPGLDGVEVTRAIRSQSDCPILMLTARDAEADKLLGLEVGADDYMTKPFSVLELGARVRAILRRTGKSHAAKGTKNSLSHRGVQLDVDKHRVLKNNQPLHLTSAQFELLRILMQEPGRVYSRRDLIEVISGYVYEGYERTVDVQIKNIRKVIEDDPAEPTFIQTVWGVGYKVQD